MQQMYSEMVKEFLSTDTIQISSRILAVENFVLDVFAHLRNVMCKISYMFSRKKKLSFFNELLQIYVTNTPDLTGTMAHSISKVKD